MSVLTKLLLLATLFFMLVDAAPNKTNEDKIQFLSQLRPRDKSPSFVKKTRNPCLTASSSSRAPLSNTFATGRRWFAVPSGTVNSGSSGVVPYQTEGAPYKNLTSLYTEQGNGEGENGQSGLGNQCPPQQTVTLPPQMITLPAQTVTMTPAPETITTTITSQALTETVTVTVTTQTQTTTMTVWMTVTANQASSCPSSSNAAGPQIAPVPGPNAQLTTTPIAPVSNNASTSANVPPVVTVPNLVVPLSTGDALPIENATLPAIPKLRPTAATGPTTFPADNQTSPVVQQTSSSLVSPIITSIPIIAPYPYRNTTNQTLELGSGSSRGFRPTGSGFAKPTNRHFPSHFVSIFVTDTPISTTTIGPSPTKEYFPGNGSSLLTPPSRANATVFRSTTGPTAPFSPTREYFKNDGSSLLTPPAQANATSVPPMRGATAPVITPAVVGSSQTLAVVVGSVTPPPLPPITQSNTSISIPAISTPIPPPSPPIVQPNTSISLPASTSSSQTPQPLNISTPPLCTNGTTAQNMTSDFSEIPPIPSMPLILQGLNYTTFAPVTAPTASDPTSPLPPPTHLLALPASEPKRISLAPGSLSFSLTSLSLSCGDGPPSDANCTLRILGLGAAEGAERTVDVGGGPGAMQSVRMDSMQEGGAGWEGLSEVSLSAEMGGVGVGVGVGLGQVVYELVRAC